MRLGSQPMPLCFSEARGSKLRDLDGNTYIDYSAGMGPAILGHASAAVTDAVERAGSSAQLYAGQSQLELELARRLCELLPYADLIRIGLTGSEMAQTAIRLARAHTGKLKLVKFQGHYHGWYDNILVNLGSAPAASNDTGTIPVVPESKGQPSSVAADLSVLPWNNESVLREFLDAHHGEVAGVIMEPVMCNTGVISPVGGFLEAAREICNKYGVVLIFDEVITGFRLDIAGSYGRFGVAPDLAIFAKALGGGFPISAIAGHKEIMQLLASGEVNHSGTYNANLLSLTAGIATFDELARDDSQVLKDIDAAGNKLMEGIRQIAENVPVSLKVQGFGSVFNTYFSDRHPIESYDQFTQCDDSLLRKFVLKLQERGVRPTARGTWFVTAGHTGKDIEDTLQAVAESARDLS